MKHTSEVWAERVKRWQASGLDATAFAAKEGCSEKTLAWWRWHLGKVRGKHARKGAEIGRAATFVELVAPQIVREAVPSELPFEVALPGGVRVVVPARFEQRSLEALLSALGGGR